MTKFIESGNIISTRDSSVFTVHDHLPVGTYIAEFNPFQGFYLRRVDNFIIPDKVYGSASKIANRVIKTFKSRPLSTGVLLAGLKGSGKTLTSKIICNLAVEEKMPTIIISRNFCDDNFMTFIQSINNDCIILFDEFEKIYQQKEQESILTMLDGVISSRKLFLFTCNNIYKINTNMINRPGRIYYRIEYERLEKEFIEEFCNDKLNEKNYIKSIVNISDLVTDFNFDMLQAIVEECNLYNEDPTNFIDIINARPSNDEREIRYNVELKVDNVIREVMYSTWSGNPLFTSINIEYQTDEKDEDGEKIWLDEMFMPANIVKMNTDHENGATILYKNGNAELKLTREKEQKFSYRYLF